jgi:endonuclease YncB( thermonuclease family)
MTHTNQTTFSLGIILLLTMLMTGNAQAGTLSIVETDKWVRVEKVFDGDTFRTTQGEKVRLLGINAPEITHGTEPGEPMGRRAATLLRQLILGRTVRLKTDVIRRDAYTRLLAQVYLRDGTWINARMVKDGMAYVYTFVPNVRWAKELITYEKEARKQRVGIWNTNRFRILSANEVKTRHVGQFRLIQGRVLDVQKNGYGFRMGKLYVTVPRVYRQYFESGLNIRRGMSVLVHGTIRAHEGKWFLALHSPTDLEKMNP